MGGRHLRGEESSPLGGGTRFWVLLLFLGICGFIATASACIFSNLEVNKVNRRMLATVKKIDAAKELRAKLEVEKARLVATHELQARAEAFGMGEPTPGQIRRMQIGNGSSK